MESLTEEYQQLIKLKPNSREALNLIRLLSSSVYNNFEGYDKAELKDISHFFQARSAEVRKFAASLLYDSKKLDIENDGAAIRALVDSEKKAEVKGSLIGLLSCFPEYKDDAIKECFLTKKESILSPAFQMITNRHKESCMDFYLEALCGKNKFRGAFLQGLAAEAVCKYSQGEHFYEIIEFVKRFMLFNDRDFGQSSLIIAMAYIHWSLKQENIKDLHELNDYIKLNWRALADYEQLYLRRQYETFYLEGVYGQISSQTVKNAELLIQGSGIKYGYRGESIDGKITEKPKIIFHWDVKKCDKTPE